MAATEPLLGRTLAGRFRITGFIGEGAMATVFRGVDLTQQGPASDVAVKVMHQHLGGDPTFTGRFRLEARAAARLQHPNSVAIVDCGEDGRLLYIAMELVQGRDLAEILTLERRIGPARACRFLAGVCDALAAAHEQSIVHRDLKPENVMVVESPDAPGGETVKVLDFGIAKMLDKPAKKSDEDGPASALTRVGTVVGTPAYMSPEQCRGQPVDRRSDLYTCGVLLYQLVTGKLPFWSESPFEIAAKQVREMPPPPSHHVDGVDRELEDVILRALAKKPEDRFARAEEMRDALAALAPRLREERLEPRQGPPPPPLSPMRDSMASAVTDVRPNGPGPAVTPRPGTPQPGNPSRASQPPGAFAPVAPPSTPPPPMAPPTTPSMGGSHTPPGGYPGSTPAGAPRIHGGTIPMGGGLDQVVRQIHEEAARQQGFAGMQGGPSAAELAPAGGGFDQGPMLPGQLARPVEETRRGPPSGLVAFMVVASIAIGVGAGMAAWFFSR